MDAIRQMLQPHVRLPFEEEAEPLAAGSVTQEQEPQPQALAQTAEEEREDYTTHAEILGWCLYSWAAEPFIVSAVSTYVPLLLEQFARENGVRLDDHSKPCIPNDPIDVTPIPPPPEVGATIRKEHIQCVVYVLGRYIDTSSYALYTFSISVAVQTLVVISMSGAADRGHYRKQLLVAFGTLGAIVTILFRLISSERYYLSSIFAIVTNSCFGAVNVCGNSFLPILVDNLKASRIQQRHHDLAHEHEETVSSGNLFTKISGMGAASGYIAALIVQLITMFIVIKTGSTTSSIQSAIFVVGLWWLLFQVPIVMLLKSRASGPELVLRDDENVLFQYIRFGWHTLFVSIKHASMLKDVLIYLLGWFIVSDSVVTINSAAVLFARSELLMSTPKLVIVGILSVLFAIAGSLTVPMIQRQFGITPKGSLLCVICGASVIPFYGILGFFFQDIGLKHEWEMYALAVWYGFTLGALATVSRSLFAMLIPKGKESTFFSLFSVTDKGSSIIGPTVTALITDKTHNIRYCFYFLFVLLILALPVFAMLDVERGKLEAQSLETVDEE